jgi:prepilin-type N-terminal cleavage/methylation domain-containing protein
VRRRGFTLVEVVVAFAIGTVVVLGARALLEALGAQTARVAAAARDADADANGERLLRALVGRLEIGAPSDTFGGDERSARFSSWCQAPRGWQERCRVTLGVEQAADGVAVVTRLSTGETVVLKRGRRTEGLRYLVDAASGGRWFVRWGEGVTVPQAIGILVDGDTTIVRIGERG